MNLEICFLLSALSLGLACFAPSPGWFYLIFFLRGVVMAAMFISGISIVYEFTDAENRPTYIGLANTIRGVAGAIAPLIGGLLFQAFGPAAPFLIGGLMQLVLLVFALQKLKPGSEVSAPVGMTRVANSH